LLLQVDIVIAAWDVGNGGVYVDRFLIAYMARLIHTLMKLIGSEMFASPSLHMLSFMSTSWP